MKKRWAIVSVGSLIHLCLGTVYAWSFFQNPIVENTGWSNAKVAFAFSLAILVLGLTAAWAGSKIDRYKPNNLSFVGGILFGAGYLISSFALKNENIWLLYLGYGIFGGAGLGLAYVTPVATVSRWFTKHQGVATGIVVMGFGLGAFLMSKVLAPLFLKISGDISETFLYIGITFGLLIPVLSRFLVLPPESEGGKTVKTVRTAELINQKSVLIWLIFTLNIIAGMIFISFQSPLLQELLRQDTDFMNGLSSVNPAEALAKAGATLIGISALFNGIGRFFWGSVSDRIGRLEAFQLILTIQALCFGILIFVENPWVFAVLVCVILLCYGGGFGVMPSLVKDEFGAEKMAAVYGAILTGWGVGGMVGPQLIAYLKDHMAAEAGYYAYISGLVILLIAIALSFVLRTNKAALPVLQTKNI